MIKIRTIWLLLFTLLLIGLTATYQRKTAVAQEMQPRAYLPIVVKDGTGVIGPVHQGIATYYYATGAGNCGFPATPDDLMVAAINNEEYDNAKWCGAFARVNGKKGSIIVRIVDRCADCFTLGHLDLSLEAFALIDDIPLGRVPITWQIVSPPLADPISYYFDEGSHQWWASVQVRNHRNPIEKFEYMNDNGTFVEVPRQMWNRFDLNNAGSGPFTFRVTDILGNVLQDSNIPLTPGSATQGGNQFPAP